jgi:hypothetical protein
MRRPVSRRGFSGAILAGVLSVVSSGGPPVVVGASGNPPTILFAGEVLSALSYDHVLLVYNTHLDQTVPIPLGDFTIIITVDGTPRPPVSPVSGSYLLSGLAGIGDPFDASGATFVRLNLPAGVTFGPTSDIQVVYDPGTAPLRDLSLTTAGAQTVSAEMLGDSSSGAILPLDFQFLFPLVDSGNATNRLMLVFTGQVDLGSIPAPDRFVVTVNGSPVAVTAVEPRVPDVGLGFVDLVLETPVWSGDHVNFSYTPGANPFQARNGGVVLVGFAQTDVALLMTNQATAVAAGGTVATGAGEPLSPTTPLTTAVTSPNAGLVTIAQTAVDPSPIGYTFFGQQVQVTAPPATSATHPLVLDFAIDASLVPAGQDAASIVVFRNGVPIANCTGPVGTADPSPCVASRVALAGGDIEVTVNTLAASRWNFAVVAPYAFSGFRAPVDGGGVRNLAKAGSAIPVKFSLSGDRGMTIFTAGSPTSRRVACDTSTPIDPIEQTVTAGATTLNYSTGADQYSYVWKTDAGWAGTCRLLTLAYGDGTLQSALFQFK